METKAWFFEKSNEMVKLECPGFLNISTSEMWGWNILCCWGCPVHCRIVSSVPGLYLLDASNIDPVMTTKNVLRH